MDLVVSIQLSHECETLIVCLNVPREAAPSSTAALICDSVIALQRQTYIYVYRFRWLKICI